MLGVIDGQGQPPLRGVMGLSRPEFVGMAQKEIASVKVLNGVRLAAQVVEDRAPGKFHILVDFTSQPVSSSARS